MRWLAVAILALQPVSASAVTLELPSTATLRLDETSLQSSYNVPVGGWSFGTIPTIEAEGTVSRQVWRIDTPGMTTLQILAPLRQQLQTAGFSLLYDCRSETCGGFDFRFGTDVAPPPEMEVNLGDFRFLAARRGTDPTTDFLTLFISRTSRAGFVQMITVVAGGSDEPRPVISPVAAAPEVAPDVAPAAATFVSQSFDQVLETLGHVVLSDLSFESGSSQLGAGPFASLQSLATYLAANPTRTVALVGHTDSAGTLDANIALSRQRAASVVARLVSDLGVANSQLEAQGMGYLAPVASNLTPEGRAANRRVEVILTSTN